MASREKLLETLILRIYEYCNSGDADAEIEDEQIFDLISDLAGKPIVNILINNLFQQGWLRQTRSDPVTFVITEAFLDEAERIRNEEALEKKSTLQTNAPPAMVGMFLDVPAPIPTVPASDRVVSRNDNQSAYDQAVEALNEAVRAYRDDQHFDNEFSSEKRALLGVLSQGQELLKNGRVRVSMMVITIIEPLKTICTHYREAIVVSVITSGIDQVLTLVQTALGFVLRLAGLAQ